MTDDERAVAETATLVAACWRTGATALSAGTILEAYGTESGVRLDALAADRAALAAAAVAAEEALVAGRHAAGLLAQAGPGGSISAATDFLDRQCRMAAGLVSGMNDAAAALDALRRTLSRVIAEKADTAVRINGRVGPRRQEWLAAAAAVTAGSGDAAAADVVARQIAPYVQTDIAGEWMGAMRAATDTASNAYTGALAALDARAPALFQVPAIPVATPGPLPPVAPVRGPGALPPLPAGTVAPEWASPPGLQATASPPGWAAETPGPPVADPFAAPAFAGHGVDPPGVTPSRPDPAARDDAEGDADPESDTGAQATDPVEPPDAVVPDPDPPASAGAGADSAEPVPAPPEPPPAAAELPAPPATPLAAEALPAEALPAEALPAEALETPTETPAAAAGERTPCEIAADELAQVGR